MLSSLKIRTNEVVSLSQFLENQDFQIDDLTDTVCTVTREGELPVFIQTDGQNLYFEVDLGNISQFESMDLYFRCLDLNTEILPVSIGLDTTNKEDPRLVLVESREVSNLDENEILSVFSAMEIATDKVEKLLEDFLK